MAETTFRVTYDGDAIANGRIDVQDLAPALLALADVFREANAVVFPDADPVSLQVQALEDGSFDVGLVLAHQDLVDRIVSIFTSDPAQAIVNLRDLVLFGSGSLFFFIRWANRRSVTEGARTADGQVLMLTAEGDSVAIPPQTLALYRNARVRRKVREVVKPLEKDGIDTVVFRETDTSIELSNGDVPAFDVPATEPEPLLDTRVAMAVSIAAPAFVEDNKWRLSDGDRNFHASIVDEAFLQRVDDGEPFRKGDILEVQMHIRQWRDDTGLHTEWNVERVERRIPRAQPIMLPLGFDQGEDAGPPLELGPGESE